MDKVKVGAILALFCVIGIIAILYFYLTLPEQTVTYIFSQNFDKIPPGDVLPEYVKWGKINTTVIQTQEAPSPPNILAVSGHGIILLPLTNLTDYTFEIKGRLLRREWGYGIIFRVTPTDTFYKFYSCQYDPGSGDIGLYKKFNGNEMPLAKTDFNTDVNWHTIKVEVKGNEFKCYVDGTLVLKAIDNEYGYGAVGIEIWNGIEAYFDDVKIYS
jgi:hypothetical protein